MVVTLADQMWVLDTKWKVLSSSTELGEDTSRSRYGLSQSDFYQLFAYGHKYLRGKGHLFLVYPQTKNFTAALSPFRFSDDLVLWVVPFDLDRDLLVDTPGGLPVSWVGAGWITHGVTQANVLSEDHVMEALERHIA